MGCIVTDEVDQIVGRGARVVDRNDLKVVAVERLAERNTTYRAASIGGCVLQAALVTGGLHRTYAAKPIDPDACLGHLIKSSKRTHFKVSWHVACVCYRQPAGLPSTAIFL